MAEQQKRIGQRLGNYLLESLLGRGAFAEVYLGSHMYLKRQAAIKVLHTYLSKKEFAAFQREAEVIAGLDHPHIIRIYDFDVQQGTPFLAMDYLPNGTLRQQHPKGACVPLALVVSYIKQVAEALQYAHNLRLIHRDVKPENILLGRHNEVILSDFGIAAIAHGTTSLTPQTFAGTIPYMAPEQIQARPLPASDQYALAVVAYEWLTGERPFVGSSTEIFAQHLMTPPPPLRQKLPTLPEAVEQVVLTALAKEPEKRFPSVESFAAALEDAYRTVPGTLDPKTTRFSSFSSPPLLPQPSTVSVAPQPAQLLPSPTTTALPVELAPRSLFVPYGPYAVFNMYDGHIGPKDVGTEEYRIEPDHRLQVRAVEWSPDGTRLATMDENHSLIHVWNAAGAGNVVTFDAQAPIAWSPEGTYLACAGVDRDRYVVVWNAADRVVTLIYHGHTDPTEFRPLPPLTLKPVESIAWSPDGTRIASSHTVVESHCGEVHVWNAKDGGNVVIYTGHVKTVNAVTWSPDGTRLASASDDGTVQVWNAATGRNIYTYYRHSMHRVDGVAWSPDGTRLASASRRGATVHVWNAADGNPIGTLSLNAPATQAPHDRQVVTGQVQAWNATTRNVVTLNQYGRYSFSPVVAWSPDATQIVSLFDGQIHMWDAMNGRNVTIQYSPVGALGVAWSPDGIRIATSPAVGSVQVLSAPVHVSTFESHPPTEEAPRSRFWPWLRVQKR